MLKKFFISFTLYGLVPILTKAVGFILIPIYANYLTPEDFGVQDIFMSFVMLMTFLISLEIYSAVGRYFHECETFEEKKVLISTGFLFQVITSLIVILFISIAHSWVNNLLFSNQDYLTIYWITLLIIPFSASFDFFSVIMRYENKPKTFLFITIIQLMAKLTFTIYFIVFLQTGVIGIFYGQVIGLIIGNLGYFHIIKKYISFSFDIQRFRVLVKYSLPLVPGLLIVGFEPNISKYIIRTELSIQAVGIFSFALRLVSILAVISYALRMTWQPFFFENIKKEDKNFVQTNEIYLIFLNIFLCMCLMLTLFSKEIIMLISPKSYWEASSLVGLLSLYFVSNSLTEIAIIGANYSNNTSLISLIEFISKVIIVLILYFFINSYGLIVIPISYSIGGIIKLLLSMKITKKYMGIQFPWLYSIFGFIAIVVINILTNQLGISLLTKILFLVAFILSGFIFVHFKRPNYEVQLFNIIRLLRTKQS